MSKTTVSAPKAHALLGASSSARWLACSPSARMCEDIPEIESPYAAEGTLAHEISAAVNIIPLFYQLLPSFFQKIPFFPPLLSFLVPADLRTIQID